MHLVIACILLLGLAGLFGLAALLCLDWLETAEDVHVPLVMTGDVARRMNAGELYVIYSVAEVPRVAIIRHGLVVEGGADVRRSSPHPKTSLAARSESARNGEGC